MASFVFLGHAPSTSIQKVEFDLAVTTTESSNGGASSEITVVGLLHASDRETVDSAGNSASRIKFVVPIAFTK